MNVTRMALLLAAAGFAAKLYMDYTRRKEGATGPVLESSTDAPGTPAEGTVAQAVGGQAESPNDAERLQARGFAETLPGEGAAGAGLFGSNSQRGPEPGTPGLPDFARGA